MSSVQKEEWVKEWISGSAKKKEFGNGGYVINVSLAEDDLAKFRKSESKAGKKFLSFTLSSKESSDQFGNDYSLSVSKPASEVGESSAPSTSTSSAKGSNPASDDGWN